MRSWAVLARWVALGVLATVQACAPRALEPSPSAMRRVPIGLCEDYPEESRSLEAARKDFELLRSLGVGTLRVSLGWDAIEPERDRYDLEFWDAFVDMAVREYHLTLIPYVAYTPAWNSDGNDTDYWKTPPRDPAEFGELMGLLARRYAGRIHSWELWNEPDNRDYWLGSAKDYAELARAGAQAIDAVDPSIDVVSGGLAGHTEFLAELFDDWDGARVFDVVNLHAYYETWNPEPLETLPGYVGEAAAIIARHGGRQALWMAEIGYGNYRNGRQVSAQATAVFAYEHTLEYQAVALARSLALLLASPVSLIAWYELADPPATDGVIGDVNNRHLGVTFADHRPKPAASALAFLARLFADGFSGAPSGLRLDALAFPSELEARAFVTGRHTLVVMAWLRTQAPIGDAKTGLGDAIDTRHERLRVRGPYRMRDAPTLHDALGNVIDQNLPAAPAAALDFELELKGGEVLIAEVAFGPS
jgi:glycosyl hydrolase family 39 (putative alpha-L-iduronidase)